MCKLYLSQAGGQIGRKKSPLEARGNSVNKPSEGEKSTFQAPSEATEGPGAEGAHLETKGPLTWAPSEICNQTVVEGCKGAASELSRDNEFSCNQTSANRNCSSMEEKDEFVTKSFQLGGIKVSHILPTVVKLSSKTR